MKPKRNLLISQDQKKKKKVARDLGFLIFKLRVSRLMPMTKMLESQGAQIMRTGLPESEIN